LSWCEEDVIVDTEEALEEREERLVCVVEDKKSGLLADFHTLFYLTVIGFPLVMVRPVESGEIGTSYDVFVEQLEGDERRVCDFLSGDVDGELMGNRCEMMREEGCEM
jgi:hypothetical protein